MSRILAEDGVIVLGASESVLGLSTKLVSHPQHRGFFQFAGRAAAAPAPAYPQAVRR